MSKRSRSRELPRLRTVPLLVLLALMFLLGSAVALPAFAQEDTTGTESSEQTIIQESTSSETSAEGASGKSAGAAGIKVGGGEAIAGDAYAGNGCAKAGDVTAGDCDGKGAQNGGSQDGRPGNGGSGNGGEAAPPEEDEDETSAPESTTEESTREEPASEGTTSEGTILEETTLLEETTQGETTSSPETAPDEAPLCPTAPPEDAVEATIEGTADGDTLALAEPVEGYDTVRLIGVDTPELEGEDGQPEPFAEEASDFTAEELEGQKVLLQIGEEEADQYGRLLAYVWTGGATEDGFVGGLKRVVGMGEAELFNLTLLEKGYARVLTIEPNDLHADCFEASEAEVRNAGVGLWAEDEGTGTPADDQYDEETTQETTEEASPPRDAEPDTESVQNTPVEQTLVENALTEEPQNNASAAREDDKAPEEPERRAFPSQDQYKQGTPAEAAAPEPEIQDEEVQDPETQDEEVQDEEMQEPEVQESVAPSGGDEPALLETAASPAASASPEPAETLPVQTASRTPVSSLPETGGPSILTFGVGLAAAGLLAGTMLGFLAVRSFLRRDVPGGR